jgi:hypothetical protein
MTRKRLAGLLLTALVLFAIAMWPRPQAPRETSQRVASTTALPPAGLAPGSGNRAASSAARAPVPQPPSSSDTYTEVRAAAVDYAAQSLCDLLDTLGSRGHVGLYRVLSLTGRTEPLPGGTLGGYTYAQLERVGGVQGGEPAHAVARLTGGPIGPNAQAPTEVSLRVGETVGVLLRPDPEHPGYVALRTLDVFHQTGANYDNGQLQWSGALATDFLARVRQARQGECQEQTAMRAAHANGSGDARLRAMAQAEVVVDEHERSAEAPAAPEPPPVRFAAQ